MNKRGIVIRILNDRIVVLDENNKSFVLKKRNYVKLGDSIDYNENDIYAASDKSFYNMVNDNIIKVKNNKKPAVVIGSIILFIIIVAIIASMGDGSDNEAKGETANNVYAYIDYNVNPSIEIGINKDNIVVEANSFSDEGEYLLLNSAVNNLDIYKATERIITEMNNIGYLSSDKKNNYLLISGAVNGEINNENEENVKKILKGIFEIVVKNKGALNKLDVVMVNQNYRKDAMENKITSGLYSVYKESQKQKLNMKIDSFKANKLSSINKVNLKNILVDSYAKVDVSLGILNSDKSNINKGEDVLIKINTNNKDIDKMAIYLNGKLHQTINGYKRNFNLNNLEPAAYELRVDIKFKNGAIEKVEDNFVIIEKPQPVSMGNGLMGNYYNNKDLNGSPIAQQVDPMINFNWDLAGPAGMADNFSIKWTGMLEPLYSEQYTFFVTSDDGCRLKINGHTIIDQWTNHSATEYSGQMMLEAGQKYYIELDYYENEVDASVSLAWQSQSQAKGIIPQAQLYSTATQN